MFSGRDVLNPAYPTQWAMNPSAYQDVDSSQVDWAALAQQWIAMKEAAAIVSAPQPPSMKPDEEGEAPMEVENPDHSDGPPHPGAEWNAATNSWNTNNWNQWGSMSGWGWPGSGDQKMPGDGLGSMIDPYSQDNAGMPGYTTSGVSAPTFQHGYWTATQADASRSSSRSRDRRSKSRSRDHKSSRSSRSQREIKAPSLLPPVIEPLAVPSAMPMSSIDAAKRRQLPAWIREGLEKMEREKQKAVEREASRLERQQQELAAAERRAAQGADGGPPPKSKFESDSEPEEEASKEEKSASPPAESPRSLPEPEEVPPTSAPPAEAPALLAKKSREEIMQEVMLAVRRSLTEILLEVTDQEIQTVSQEELARYTAAQASRLNAMKASKSKALAAIATGLGLGAYESSSEGSSDDDPAELTDQQLQEIIKRKRVEFERTSREIEAEVRRADSAERARTPPSTPSHTHVEQGSATPPPPDSDTPEKPPERRPSRDKKSNHKTSDKVDGVRKLEVIPEEKPKKSDRNEHTPSPVKGNSKNSKDISSSSSDSEEDSSSSASRSSSASEPEQKVESKPKKRKRRSSDSSESHKKSKKEKSKKSHKDDKYSKSKHHDDYEKSKSKKKDDYYDRHKSSRSRDYERSHKEKYRDDSDEDRPRKRSKRSRSASHSSRSGRRYDKYDRYERERRRR